MLANVMLSACLLFKYLAAMIHALSFIDRYQLPRFFAQEELAKCQVLAYQDHDGQACSTLLIYFVGGDGTVVSLAKVRKIVMHNMKPCTLGPTVSKRRELIGS